MNTATLSPGTNAASARSLSVTLVALTASLSGFLFGFDTIVISGAEQAVQALWQTSDGVHGLAISAALWGTVIGALGAFWPSDRFGRRKTLFFIGLLYAVSALGSALAWDEWSFMAFRFIGGIGVGISSVAAPTYIAEVAPRAKRGRLVGLFQLSLVIGILVATLSNSQINAMADSVAAIGDNAWRWMLGVELLPAIIYTVLTRGLPESPRWLATVDDDPDAARATLARLDPDGYQDTMAEIMQAEQGAPSKLLTSRLAKPLILVTLIAFFNQMSGINAVFYYGPRLFELAQLGQQGALLASVGMAAVNVAATLVGIWLIDRLGRRPILMIGCVGFIASLLVIAYGFQTQSYALVPIAVFAFIGSHGIGSGAIIWSYIAEVFPNDVRAKGQAYGCGVHWIMAALITLVWPFVLGAVPTPAIFLTFAALMVAQLVFALFYMVETKGKSLEELSAELVKA